MTNTHNLSNADKFKIGGCFAAIVTVLVDRSVGTDDPRTGASFNRQDPDGNVLLHLSSGTGTEQQFQGWNKNVWAKNGMLLRNPQHRLSWESLHWDTGLYPGGKRNSKGRLGAISGFKWEHDECGMHFIDLTMEDDDENAIREMLEISGNLYWDELLPEFQQAFDLIAA